MPSRRCSTCGICYPDSYRFNKCPIHGEDTQHFIVAHDEDWEAKAQRLVVHLELQAKDADLIPTVEGRVTVRDGRFWTLSWDVIDSGIHHRLQPDELIRVGQQVFEILGYRDETREYLVRTFSMELSEEDLRKLADG